MQCVKKKHKTTTCYHALYINRLQAQLCQGWAYCLCSCTTTPWALFMLDVGQMGAGTTLSQRSKH